MELIPVCNKQALMQAGCFFSPNTLRKWHSRNTHPGLVVKIGGRLFLNKKVLGKIVEKEVVKQRKRAQRLELLK
ncbi:MAG TPA: hypothetical protein ENI35_00640 [Candidatus Desulfofervidus auxilii]|uniref:DNA-binding protein n=1 Tax=Desulfofervidus auxilii TaxID=1621989 RepID=A0A7C2A331_DESA2|nr:hypothetical protein [Candidatus Desulfofervidus auxilii]